MVITQADPDFDTVTTVREDGSQRFPRLHWGVAQDFSISQLADGRCYPVAPSLMDSLIDFDDDFTPHQAQIFRFSTGCILPR